jgi:hypothetical protein
MNYQKKYLKYKQKYLELKSQIGGDTNWTKINEELSQLPTDEFKFVKKEGYFLHIQRLKDKSNFKIMVFDYPNKIPEVKFNEVNFNKTDMIAKFGQWNSERELIEILNNYTVFSDRNELPLMMVNKDVAKYVTEQRKKKANENILLRVQPSMNPINPGPININLK